MSEVGGYAACEAGTFGACEGVRCNKRRSVFTRDNSGYVNDRA